MSRTLAVLLLGLALLPGRSAAQHAVGVSATVLPEAPIAELDWALVPAAAGMELRLGGAARGEAPVGADSRILQHACVAADRPAPADAPGPAPGPPTLECRTVVPRDAGGALPARVHVEKDARGVVITRIIAANA